MHKIVNADKKFLEKGWKDANEGWSGKEKIKVAPATEPPTNQRVVGIREEREVKISEAGHNSAEEAHHSEE
jgi:antiviral helicase SKI2